MILGFMKKKTDDQGSFFSERPFSDETVFINERCRLHTREGYRVVSVAGIPIAHYAIGDRMGEAYAMVSLVDQSWAYQNEVAHSFGCSERTVRRNVRRFEQEGMTGLGRPVGYPRGKARLPASRVSKVNAWMSAAVSQREIARRLGVGEKAVRKLVRRLGWKPGKIEQLALPMESADPKLSAISSGTIALAQPEPAASEGEYGGDSPGADPKLSAISSGQVEPLRFSMDPDPGDRSVDRLLACMGLLEDASPRFRKGLGVTGAGVLLAIPVLVKSGVLEIAREVYGSLGPSFYGLRTTLVTFLVMALLRIKRPEGLKEHSPEQLGRLLGLDRAPEVKTLRRKLSRLASLGRAKEFGRELARHRVKTRGQALGFLYVDGHVRVYHGKRRLPKAYVTQRRLAMPATTDYWVNDQVGDPLFVVNSEANRGLVEMLPAVLAEVRRLVGDRQVTVVFDRGGWSPKLFGTLLGQDFDILTYRKGRTRPVSLRRFGWHEAVFDGRRVRYRLAEKAVWVGQGKARLKLRQVTRLSDDGKHQTHIVTSRWELPAIEVAYRMFERWRQENFFKYLGDEFALDALVDYGTEAANETREVPNPLRQKLDAELKKLLAQLSRLEAMYGVEAMHNVEGKRRTMRGFKIAQAGLHGEISRMLKRVIALERRRTKTPRRVPIGQVTPGEVIKMATEKKLLTDILKMVAYQVEGELVRLVEDHYRRSDEEGRTLVQNMLFGAGDIESRERELLISLDPLSAPHRTQAFEALCAQLTATRTKFPGTDQIMRFAVKPAPETCMAFPGPRPSEPQKPDKLARG